MGDDVRRFAFAERLDVGLFKSYPVLQRLRTGADGDSGRNDA